MQNYTAHCDRLVRIIDVVSICALHCSSDQSEVISILYVDVCWL